MNNLVQDQMTFTLLIILLICVSYYIFTYNSLEYFNDTRQTTPQTNILTHVKPPVVYSEYINILGDPLFSNVALYNNDDNPYVLGEESGLEKCMNQCDGNCVEFGVTGIAYCFPNQ
jgi:hypothetical protein